MLKLAFTTLLSVIWNKSMFFWSARFLASKSETLIDDDGVDLIEALTNGDSAKAEVALKKLAATLAEMTKD